MTLTTAINFARTTQKSLTRLLRARFPVHDWTYQSFGEDDGDVRTCAVCGRAEEYDCGGGFQGGGWFVIAKGDRKAHLNQ